MAIGTLAVGNILGGKYSPGVFDIWILGSLSTAPTTLGAITSITEDGVTGEITQIAGTGTWYKFQCSATTGQAAENGAFADGGREVDQQLTYRFVGVSKAQRDAIEELADNSRLKVVASYRGTKDNWLFGEENGLSLITDAFDTGVGGGGAGAVGTNVVLQGFELSKANKLADALTATAQTPMTVQ